jgi:hypothetical protein
MKKIISFILAFLFFASSVFAYAPTSRVSGRMSGGMKGGMTGGIDKSERIKRLMPYGLTFYKDFSKIPNGTYPGSASAWLNADYSIGSGVATYTSTSGNFTINGGYSSTTADSTILKYLIAGNRTAASETIVIKLKFNNTIASLASDTVLLSSDTKRRTIVLSSAINDIYFRPNSTDSLNCVSRSGEDVTINTSYLLSFTCGHASPYATFYVNNVVKTNETVDDFTNPAWGASFYLGSESDGTSQSDVIIEKIIIFNRLLSISELATIS